MSDRLYRFLSFPSFVDIAQRKCLTFVTYDMWEDPYEGFVLGAMKSNDGRQQIASCLERMRHSMDPATVLGILSGMRYTVHLQSWTRVAESDALWRIYGFGNMGVRIATTTEKIRAIGSVNVMEVDYGELSLEEELRRICVGDNQIDVRQAFSTKRKAFKHEEEVRLVTNIDHSYLPVSPRRRSTDPSPEVFKAALRQFHSERAIDDQELATGLKKIDDEERRQGLPPNQVKPVSFGHVGQFIESVLVHPMAPAWYVSMVSEFCDRNALPFEGKSQLYTYKHG